MTSSYGFGCITPTSSSDLVGACAAGQSQLTVDVSDDPNPQLVLFTFRNTGPTPSSITAVYFADGSLLSIAQVINGSGVSFSQGATPPNLPGGNSLSPPFQTTAGFLADSDPPVQPNGVNPGESLGILFNLQPAKTYADVLNALSLGGASGGLRIGAQVQGFTTFNGVSASFVDVPTPVPVPAAGWLLLCGIAGLSSVARRRSAPPS